MPSLRFIHLLFACTIFGVQSQIVDDIETVPHITDVPENNQPTRSGLQRNITIPVVKKPFTCAVVDPRSNDSDRQAHANLWPDGIIPYSIHITVSNMANNIETAIQEWEEHTCLKFHKDYTQNPYSSLVIFGQRDPKACTAVTGKRYYRNQLINLGEDCNDLEVIIHEIGHAIGLAHQHNRPDRDKYIKILWGNIETKMKYAFRIAANTETYSVPYDYTSVMHYNSYVFTKSDKPTILALKMPYTGQLGQSKHLTHRDKMIVNRMYRCDSKCGDRAPICQNGGFVDKTCRCVCPPTITGSRCENVPPNYDYYNLCGDLNIRSEGEFTSLNWPDIYPPGKYCFWKIEAPPGRRVQIEFTDFKVIQPEGDKCLYDDVSIYLRGEYPPEHKLCDADGKGRIFTSVGPKMMVSMKSQPNINVAAWQKGFSAKIKFV